MSRHLEARVAREASWELNSARIVAPLEIQLYNIKFGFEIILGRIIINNKKKLVCDNSNFENDIQRLLIKRRRSSYIINYQWIESEFMRKVFQSEYRG